MASQASSADTNRRAALTGLVLAGFGLAPQAARAASAGAIVADSRRALAELYSANPKAKGLGAKARAILVFPEVVKAGAVIGGLRGEGAMLKAGKVSGFYTISAASYGLQLGAQKYGYALFFMNEGALKYLSDSGGWSVGSGPSVVFVDEGFAKTMSTTTLSQDVYAVAFQQRGLMAGTGLEGARIKQFYPKA